MRRFLALFVVAAAALLFGSGCFSYSTLHTAKPVEQGRTQITLAPAYIGIGVDNTEGGADSTFELPTAEIAGRHGLTKDLDVGAKIYPFGVAFDVNYAFINQSNFAASVNPYLSITRFSASDDSSDASFTWGTALLNVLFDVVSTEQLTLTLGLKPGFLYAIGSSEETNADSFGVIGAMAGLQIKLTDTFGLMPNFDVLTPMNDNFGEGYLYNFGVAVMY